MDYVIALLSDPTAWIALATLTVMEVVLGIDNLIFISVLSNKLPKHLRSKARRIGIGAALVLRLGLLATIALIVKLTTPVFEILGQSFSWRDLILICGGLFLIWKATTEIHHSVDPDPGPDRLNAAIIATSMGAVVGQILLLDLIFSLDSIITAVGMTSHIPIMVVAVIIAVFTMLLAADPLARFVHNNPTVLMLALAFLLLIGTTLVADGFGAPIAKGYIYAAMAFSVLVESLNMLARRARQRRGMDRTHEN
jgi:predicted tellurium resistance membrane protein TerC